EHHGDPRTVIFKEVVGIDVVVREHKMQAVPQITGTFVVAYSDVVRKFQVDPVAYVLNRIAGDFHLAAIPELYAIARIVLVYGISCNGIVYHLTLGGFFEIYPEEQFSERVVPDIKMPAFNHPHRGVIGGIAGADIDDRKSVNGDMVALHRNDL